MASGASLAKRRSKIIGVGGMTGILLLAAAVYNQFNEIQSKIEKQINVEVSFPPVGTTGGVYQYHVWLEGSKETTTLHRVEVNLDRVPAYSKTVSVSTNGNGWKPYSSSGKKGGMKGMPDDDVYLKFEMDDFGYAKSWSLVELNAEVEFKFKQLWLDFNPSVNFSFEVPGPYHRRQEGNVDKSIKWESTEDMKPDSGWETIETVEEN
jgi:hypothetical protein